MTRYNEQQRAFLRSHGYTDEDIEAQARRLDADDYPLRATDERIAATNRAVIDGSIAVMHGEGVLELVRAARNILGPYETAEVGPDPRYMHALYEALRRVEEEAR